MASHLRQTDENQTVLAEVVGVEPSAPYNCRHPEHPKEVGNFAMELWAYCSETRTKWIVLDCFRLLKALLCEVCKPLKCAGEAISCAAALQERHLLAKRHSASAVLQHPIFG